MCGIFGIWQTRWPAGGSGSRATGDDPPAPPRPGRRRLLVGRHAARQRARLRRRRHRPPARPAASSRRLPASHAILRSASGGWPSSTCLLPATSPWPAPMAALADLQRRGLQLPGAARGAARFRATLSQRLRHRGDSGRLCGVGAGVPARFNGMWAFALWDSRRAQPVPRPRSLRRQAALLRGRGATFASPRRSRRWWACRAVRSSRRGGDLRLSGRRASPQPAGRSDLLRGRAVAAAGPMPDGRQDGAPSSATGLVAARAADAERRRPRCRARDRELFVDAVACACARTCRSAPA